MKANNEFLADGRIPTAGIRVTSEQVAIIHDTLRTAANQGEAVDKLCERFGWTRMTFWQIFDIVGAEGE